MSSERRIYTRSRARQDAADNANVRPALGLSKLPLEILLIVFAMAVKDNKGLFSLLAVCRDWRNAVSSLPTLWCRLEVTRKTTKKKVDFWMSRSKGKVSTLSITGIRGKTSTAKVFNWFSKFPDDFWTGLETLEIKSSKDLFLVMMNAGIFKRLRLRNLHFEKDIEAPRNLTDLPFTTLTSLQITGKVGDDLFAMLDRNPLLTRLSLTRCYGPLREVHAPMHVELRRLTHLELCEFNEPMSSLKKYLHIPNLQSLVFRGRRLWNCVLASCIASVDLSGLLCLQELRIQRCESSPYELVSILGSTSNITTLQLWPVDHPDTASWLKSLNPRMTDVFRCPSLQYIKLSGYHDLDLSSLAQFVEGRLRGSSSEESPEISPSERPRRIISVHIENCRHLLYSDDIEWLKANVPHFTIDSTPE